MNPLRPPVIAGEFFGRTSRMRAGGFSLLELVIVMALILIMFVMLYGSGSRSHQQRQKRICQKNLQTIYVALQIFANDHDGAFPVRAEAQSSEEALGSLVPRYISMTEPFICPGSKDKRLPEGEPFEKRTISYAYYMGRRVTNSSEVLMSDRQIDSQPKIRGHPIFSTDGKKPGNNHHKYGGNFLFSDGHLEMSGATAPFSLPLTQDVRLLNPKP